MRDVDPVVRDAFRAVEQLIHPFMEAEERYRRLAGKCGTAAEYNWLTAAFCQVTQEFWEAWAVLKKECDPEAFWVLPDGKPMEWVRS